MTIARCGIVAAFSGCIAMLAGCACGPCADGAALGAAGQAESRSARDYAMVFIMTGPLREPSEAQAQEAMQGHFANMQRMAADETLLIAGPLTEPKSDPDHRGVFVFDADTAEKGLALANTDPAAQMGVFVMRPFTLTTSAPLAELPRLEREYEARRLADPDIPDEWAGRLYVLATTAFDADLHEEVRALEGVLIAGRLQDAGTTDRLLLWLDAPNPALAARLLPEGDWTFHGWYGSPTLEDL
jgi:uncharacterized protein YciI